MFSAFQIVFPHLRSFDCFSDDPKQHIIRLYCSSNWLEVTALYSVFVVSHLLYFCLGTEILVKLDHARNVKYNLKRHHKQIDLRVSWQLQPGGTWSLRNQIKIHTTVVTCRNPVYQDVQLLTDAAKRCRGFSELLNVALNFCACP